MDPTHPSSANSFQFQIIPPLKTTIITTNFQVRPTSKPHSEIWSAIHWVKNLATAQLRDFRLLNDENAYLLHGIPMTDGSLETGKPHANLAVVMGK